MRLTERVAQFWQERHRPKWLPRPRSLVSIDEVVNINATIQLTDQERADVLLCQLLRTVIGRKADVLAWLVQTEAHPGTVILGRERSVRCTRIIRKLLLNRMRRKGISV